MEHFSCRTFIALYMCSIGCEALYWHVLFYINALFGSHFFFIFFFFSPFLFRCYFSMCHWVFVSFFKVFFFFIFTVERGKVLHCCQRTVASFKLLIIILLLGKMVFFCCCCLLVCNVHNV